jgi:hypothetical protein
MELRVDLRVRAMGIPVAAHAAMVALPRGLLEEVVGGDDDAPEAAAGEWTEPEQNQESLSDAPDALLDPASLAPAQTTSDAERGASVEQFDNGALIVRDANEHPTFYRSPSAYESPTAFEADGALKPLDVQVDDARWWANYRLDRGINTLGPDGEEASGFWSSLGGSAERQLYGAYHDLQTPYAHQQALDYAAAHPDDAERVLSNERVLMDVSAAAGYGVTRIAESLQDFGYSLGAPPSEYGARFSAGIYRLAGYSVPAVDPYIRGPWWSR